GARKISSGQWRKACVRRASPRSWARPAPPIRPPAGDSRSPPRRTACRPCCCVPSLRRRKACARRAGAFPPRRRSKCRASRCWAPYAGRSSSGAIASARRRSRRCPPGSWSGTMKRIISLWFPKLSSDRLVRRGANDWRDRAAATVGWRDNCPRLEALNAHARAAGLRVHMRLADAKALIPDLVTVAAQPEADRKLIEQLAGWCDRYTPWVAVDPLGAALAEPDAMQVCSAGGFGGDAGLLLDVTGCGHLFGDGEKGERALMADLVQRLARHDFTCRAAMADTPGAAWALARYAETQAALYCPPNGQRDALAGLPVDGLRLDPPILETFLKLGLRRIGNLYPLPRAPLQRRFGDQPLTRLDQALGKLDEPIEPRRPPPAFRSRMAFAEPIGRPEDIAAATSRLIASLCG